MQKISEDSLNKNDAIVLSRLFKYYLQFKNPYLKYFISFKNITAKSFYKKYSIDFQKLYNLFLKYDIDATNYIKFFINVLDKREKDIKTDLVNNKSIIEYINWLKTNEKHTKIYNYFCKSAKNIANECIKLGYSSSKDFIRYLISNKKIAEYYITGKISLYYFAAIPNFKKIITKLDNFSKDEFQKIFNRFELYNSEITLAFMNKTNQKVNPIKYTDDLIFKIKTKNSKNI